MVRLHPCPHMIKKVLSIYFIWFLLINFFAFYALNRFNLSPDTAYAWINPEEFSQNKNLDLINLRVHWDSFWYLKIAGQGYEYKPGEMNSIAFFPLYPSLIWTISQIPLINQSLAGWIISTLALGVGLVFLYKLVKENHHEIDPLEPIIFLLIFPTAFFLTAVYTESLFLMLSIIFFYYLFKKQFLIAGLFLTLASVCRLNGLFLFIPLIYEYFKVYGFKRFFNTNLLCFFIAPAGIFSFMFYQYLKFQEPLAFLKSQMEWGRKFIFNSEHFQLFTPASFSNFSTDIFFFALAAVAGIMLFKIRASYGLYVLFTVLVAVSTGTLMSIGRFALILFPIFILIASFKNEEFKFGWMLLSTLFLAVFTVLFVNNYWAG